LTLAKRRDPHGLQAIDSGPSGWRPDERLSCVDGGWDWPTNHIPINTEKAILGTVVQRSENCPLDLINAQKLCA
jgi:hypothetical protein